MNEPLGRPLSAAALRKRAEAQLQERGPASTGERTALETSRLLHELQVHQIELEMQNDALEQTRDDMETLLASYIDLYDNAPVCYLTVDRIGAVKQMNLTGARLLGIERTRSGQPRFGLFVSPPDRKAFSDFVERVFANGTADGCEITLSVEGRAPLAVRIEGSRSEDSERCRLVLVDVTKSRGA